MSKFKEVPDEPDSCDPEGPAEPQGPPAPSRDAKYVEASRGPDAASRDGRRQEAVRRRGATSSVPKSQDVPSSLRKQPHVPPPVPSQSESNVIGGFFSSARNMDEDKAAGTLQKMTEPIRAFSGNLVSCLHSFCWAGGGGVVGVNNRVSFYFTDIK